MPIHLPEKDLFNIQQLEVAINGPDGATHLILCTGFAYLGSASHENYTFLVGPQLSRRQFVAVIASAAISTIEGYSKDFFGQDDDRQLDASLLTIDAAFDPEACRVRVRVEVILSQAISKLAISYHVSILAELQNY